MDTVRTNAEGTGNRQAVDDDVILQQLARTPQAQVPHRSLPGAACLLLSCIGTRCAGLRGVPETVY